MFEIFLLLPVFGLVSLCVTCVWVMFFFRPFFNQVLKDDVSETISLCVCASTIFFFFYNKSLERRGMEAYVCVCVVCVLDP